MSEGLLVDEAAIRRLIPHGGSMCLLQGVRECSAERIVCETTSHRDSGNPLAIDGALSALHLVEYGAQAAAIHGGMQAAAGTKPKPGVLAAVRELQLLVEDLASQPAPLVITATRLGSSPAGSNYAFSAHAQGALLGQGRVVVMTAA